MKTESRKMRTVKLSDICILEKGQQIDTSLLDNSKKYRYINGGIKESGFYDDYNTRGESVLISEGGASCGYINYVNENFWCGCHCYRLHDITVFPKYLFHALKANQPRIMNLRTGSAMPNIQKSTIQKFELKIQDDLDSQKHIAAVLDKCSALIAKYKLMLEKYDTLTKSRFIEMFGDNPTKNGKWQINELGTLSEIGSSKRIFANEYVSEGIPFYRSKEIRELGNRERPSIELYISYEKYNEIKTKYGLPKKNDILIAAIGATIGYTWIIDTDSPFYYKDGNLILISNIKKLDSIFLNEILKTEIKAYKERASGSAQLALTIEKMERLQIPVPPIELQNDFAAFVQQIDKSKFAVQKSLEKAETLYKSLMQEYFG